MKRTAIAAVAGAVLLALWTARSGIRSTLGLPQADEVIQRAITRKQATIELVRQPRTMIAFVTGQSNAGNFGPWTVARSKFPVFEIFEGKALEARNPLLGSNGLGSTPWISLGQRLILHGDFDRVAFVLAVRGGTGIAAWLPGGGMNAIVLDRLSDLQAVGIWPTHLLWQQGESDARYDSPREKAEYASRFRTFVATLRQRGVRAPIYVALASRSADTMPDPVIRNQQKALVDAGDSILPGPDTDSLGENYRRDGTHFNAAGEQELAELWYQVLKRR